jgi:alanine or glycine:cation symporter, AGCS family
MELFSQILGTIDSILTPVLVVMLLGTGIFLTFRLGFIQFRRLGHGFAVTSGKYDDPNEPGDVSHFQALTTALSATVGIGNIAGVAMAIHWGGPGALFWMWVTAVLGMAVKYSEVTLAQHFRDVRPADEEGPVWEGTVSGGPMYYIERGLGKKWKPMAVFFAFALMITAFMTGNAVQANTVATSVADNWGIDTWITGLATAMLVGMVILGGITRIGAVTGVLAPVMAAIYVFGAMIILLLNVGEIPATFALIFREAFNPTAGVAGTGAGALIFTLLYGVQRGLFSNEAGQGSAPIAHSAAKTDEPVSEGSVALLEPFIDTILICTMTGLVILITGAWNDRVQTTLPLDGVNIVYVEVDEQNAHRRLPAPPTEIRYEEGTPVSAEGVHTGRLGFYNVGVDSLFVNREQTDPFTGILYPAQQRAVDDEGNTYTVLYGNAVRSSSPLTSLAFEQGLAPLGLSTMGRYIVLLSVLLFGISTSIAWSYYGDRCAYYLWGKKAILPYKMVFVLMHFVGATLAVTTIWNLGDTALSLVTIPNVLALFLLSGVVKKLTDSYFERKPWEENYEVHKRIVAEKKAKKK